MSSFPDIDLLRHFFKVDEHSRVVRKYAKHGWKVVSKLRPTGYYGVTFQGRSLPAHRLIWALHHGREPAGVIDHINGCPWDNRIENLREATSAQNAWNSKRSNRNRTGFRNVEEVGGGYRGRVYRDHQPHRTPVFDDPELAELAASELALKLHGEFSIECRRAA